MGEEDSVSIRFVLPPGKNETTCSEDLAYAYDQTQDAGLHPLWIPHDDVLELNFSKMDVFVMDAFDGDAFEAVSTSKATIVGPRCLLSCLQKKEPVPELPYPMFTAAMKGLIITSTGFDRDKKLHIQKLVERMSGIYSNAFHDGVTHLVAAVVRSSKYSVAVEKEIPIMTEEWVLQVWSKSQNDNVAGVDRQFARYACPALMGLTITVSQMSLKDKEVLKKSIESHGGIYSRSLDMHSTNILIIPAPEGDKFTYARKWKIPTLNSNWISDSIVRGYCLETEGYKVEKRSDCSTPSKEGVSRLSEVSLCSTIMAPSGNDTLKINETLDSSMDLSRIGTRSSDSWLKSLDLTRVVKAGPFLDGCRVFLSGFDDAQQEHLRRVLQAAGANKMSQLTPSVTHMIVKSFAKTRHLKGLGLNPHQVTVHWVVESMHLGRLASEADFAAPKMPLSNEAMVKEAAADDTSLGEDDDILALYSKKQQYDLKAAAPDPVVIAPQVPEEEDYSQLTKFLTGSKLALVGLDEEAEQELTDWIDEEGGEIVPGDFRGVLDYLVLPVHGYDNHKFKAKNIVNHLWLAECFDKGGFVEIKYFYKSYPIDTTLRPLDGVVIGISGFASQERQFLCSLTGALGGIPQETFAKKEKGDTLRSTHLVCLSPNGNKYDAALRWRLPVVSKDWIMTCCSKRTWVSEKPFLLGDSEIYTCGKPLPDSVPDIKGMDRQEGKSSQLPKTPDIVSLKSQRIDLSPTIGTKLHPTQDSQANKLQKRKRIPSEFEQGSSMPETPDRPFGVFQGKDDQTSSHSRNYWTHEFDKVVSTRPPSESQQSKLVKQVQEIESPRERRQETPRSDSQVALESLQARGIPVLEKAGRSFDDIMEDKMNRVGKSWNQTPTVGKRLKLTRGEGKSSTKDDSLHPFEGFKVYITKKCITHFDRLSKAVHRLGGSILSTYDEENVTHVIYSSNKANDSTKELRQARNDDKVIVGPDWVFECVQERRLLEPSLFPHTHNADQYSSIFISPSNKPGAEHQESRRATDKSRDLSQDIAKMNEIINAEVTDKIRPAVKRIKMTLSSTESTPRSSSLDDITKKDSSDFDSQALGSQIQWIDPKESVEQIKLAKKLSVRDSETTFNNMDFQSMNLPETMTATEQVLDEVVPSPKYRFMITGYSDDVKAVFGKLIESMDRPKEFSFSSMSGCDPQATHIIAPKFPRSEKMLCSIASGKMFLHSSYFEDCMDRKTILTPVDKYEWGHPDNSFLSKLEDEGFEKQLAKASYKWRLKISGGKKVGAFEGIVAIIHTTPKRREAFQRLIEFGGGRVLTPLPPYSDSQDATHCFAEPHKLPKSKIDYTALASKGIAVVDPIFINEYLIKDPPPPVEEYLIQEFKAIWEKHN